MKREYDLYVVLGKCGEPKSKMQCEQELYTAKKNSCACKKKCKCKLDEYGKPYCTCSKNDDWCKCPDNPCDCKPCTCKSDKEQLKIADTTSQELEVEIPGGEYEVRADFIV